MPNVISEDEIEQALLQRLQFVHGYDAHNAFTDDPADLNDGTGRTDKRDVILPGHMKAALAGLNPSIPEKSIIAAVSRLADHRKALSMVAANRELDGLIRDGVRVKFKDAKGRTRWERVRVIDFNDPSKNHFLAVSQLWIQSTGSTAKAGFRRPDVLPYVNGLPLLFIELKNSNIKLRTAFDDNLTNYKHYIPQLFLPNVLCALSNGIETRFGSMTAEWEHFFHWLRPDDEKEKIRRAEIREQGTSVERFLAGVCAKARLLDYVENEILEDENLDETQQEALEKRFASELSVIVRDDRLETIAADIVEHFPRRGYLGKAMVITVDKFTAVKMYDKVQRIWKEDLKKLRGRIKSTQDELEKRRLKRIVETMRKVKMAVVITEEAGEEQKFDDKGLDIRPHRKRLEEVDA